MDDRTVKTYAALVVAVAVVAGLLMVDGQLSEGVGIPLIYLAVWVPLLLGLARYASRGAAAPARPGADEAPATTAGSRAVR